MLLITTSQYLGTRSSITELFDETNEITDPSEIKQIYKKIQNINNKNFSYSTSPIAFAKNMNSVYNTLEANKDRDRPSSEYTQQLKNYLFNKDVNYDMLSTNKSQFKKDLIYLAGFMPYSFLRISHGSTASPVKEFMNPVKNAELYIAIVSPVVFYLLTTGIQRLLINQNKIKDALPWVGILSVFGLVGQRIQRTRKESQNEPV